MENRRCSRCGEMKPESEFLRRKEGYYYSYCKVCSRQISLNYYNRTKKAKQGIYIDRSGRKMFRNGLKNNIYWDGNMISIMKRFYPCTPNSEVIELLGISVCECVLIKKARELGLHKTKEYLHKVAMEGCLFRNLIKK